MLRHRFSKHALCNDGCAFNLKPHTPFAVRGRNLRLSPIAGRMRGVAATLRQFCGREAAGPIDAAALRVLGKRTPEKTALAALLETKITDAFGPAG